MDVERQTSNPQHEGGADVSVLARTIATVYPVNNFQEKRTKYK